MSFKLNAVFAGMLAVVAMPTLAEEAKRVDDAQSKENYTINRTFEDLSKQEIALANRRIFGCYLGCHRQAMEEVPETLSPKLEGFDPQYFYNQYVDMDNERHSGIAAQMKQYVYVMTAKDIADIALVLGEREMKKTIRPGVAESDAYKRGKELYEKACQSCHGVEGASTHKRFPPLKGQLPAYILEQMRGYRDGLRTTRDAAMMVPYAKMFSEQDYKDMATYLSGIEVKEVKRKEFITGKGMPAPEGFVLPDSGQIQNFVTFHGEDSDYTFNEPSFTISESGKVVKDNNTKLMWERDSSRVWMDAVEGEKYCDELEIDGYNDWRYPLMKELQSIADAGEFRPAVNTDVFLNMPRMSSGMWAFPVSNHPDHAWHIGFPEGHIMGQHTASTKLVRCVRADNGAAYHNMNYVDNKDGTVTETVTNRMWQQKIDYVRRDWETAVGYCENLSYAGHSDWRLPNIRELVSIVDYNKTSPAIDEVAFPNTPVKYFFWSSTVDLPGPTLFVRPLPERKKDLTPEMLDLTKEKHPEVWAQGYQIGSGLGMTKESEFYVRCIRNPS